MPSPFAPTAFVYGPEHFEMTLAERGAVADIGQITPEVQKLVNRAVRAGKLIKYRGYWDTLLPSHGMGPLKTIYTTPERVEEFRAAWGFSFIEGPMAHAAAA